MSFIVKKKNTWGKIIYFDAAFDNDKNTSHLTIVHKMNEVWAR